MAILESLLHGKFSEWTPSALKFGQIRVGDVTPSDVLPGAIILGVISGLLGSFFISINTKVNAQRAKIWTKNWHKPIDTFIFCVACGSCFYWFPYWF
jgi:H+/Cl- antiporter ClcA